jgi:hypothetical protein
MPLESFSRQTHMTLTADQLADALLKGGQRAAVENFLLSGDPDVPIFPEALVQVEVAKALRDHLNLSSVELEATTERLLQAASGRALGDPERPCVTRPGEIDIVGWSHFVPQVLVEVKDQIGGTDDGIVADALRIQELLSITHRWGEDAPHSKLPRFGALLYYVGKNSQQYERGRHLASQFIPFADRTVESSLKNIRKILDTARYSMLVKKARVVDSARDAGPDPELVGTQDEEQVSNKEQFTYCVVCVLHALGTSAGV